MISDGGRYLSVYGRDKTSLPHDISRSVIAVIIALFINYFILLIGAADARDYNKWNISASTEIILPRD